MFDYTDDINSKTTLGIITDTEQPERFSAMIELAVTSLIGIQNHAWLRTDVARELAAEIIARCNELDEGRCEATNAGERCDHRAGHTGWHRDQNMRSWRLPGGARTTDVRALAAHTKAACDIIERAARS